MTSITQNLLSDYYGFGTEHGSKKPLSSHDVSSGVELLTLSANSPDQKKDSKDDDKPTNEKLEEKTEGHMNTEMSMEREPLRSVQVWDEGNLEEEEDRCRENRYEIFLESNSIRTDSVLRRVQPSVEKKTMENEKKYGNRAGEDVSQVPNFVMVEESLLDNASDISSPMPKKRSSRKLKTSISHLTPVTRKVPNCNGVYLELTNIGMTVFPVDMLGKFSSLRMLYLENNKLTELPDELFPSLQYLQWLDVRNNELTTLPTSIKWHQCLETILLQGNRVEKLPMELCLVPKLKCLQLMRNPLIFPPKEVIALGCNGILEYLEKEWVKVNPEKPVKSEELSNDNGKVTLNPSTILCHKSKSILKNTAKMPLSKISVKTCVSPWAMSKVHNGSIREKSWGYKPNNRYDELHYKNLKQHIYNKRYSAHPCLSTNCGCDPLDFSKYSENISSSFNGYKYDDKIVKRQFLEQFINAYLSRKNGGSSGNTVLNVLGGSPSSQYEYISNKVDISNSCKLKNDKLCRLKLPNVYLRDSRRFKPSAGPLKLRMKDVEMKERVFDIITNDRTMMKLYPMQLDDPQWVLTFLETYLSVGKKWHDY